MNGVGVVGGTDEEDYPGPAMKLHLAGAEVQVAEDCPEAAIDEGKNSFHRRAVVREGPRYAGLDLQGC